MRRNINTFRDLCASVEDCGLSVPHLYVENWVELVARDYEKLLIDKYSFVYGDKEPKLNSDEEFWDLFEPYELEKI